MTIQQIRDTVGKVKPISQKQVYRYIKVCKIKPVGLRQRPQQYPDDSADTILVRLGLAQRKSSRVVSLHVLKTHRARRTR